MRHAPVVAPQPLWAKAMDSLITTLASNREFLNLTWGKQEDGGQVPVH